MFPMVRKVTSRYALPARPARTSEPGPARPAASALPPPVIHYEKEYGGVRVKIATTSDQLHIHEREGVWARPYWIRFGRKDLHLLEAALERAKGDDPIVKNVGSFVLPIPGKQVYVGAGAGRVLARIVDDGQKTARVCIDRPEALDALKVAIEVLKSTAAIAAIEGTVK